MPIVSDSSSTGRRPAQQSVYTSSSDKDKLSDAAHFHLEFVGLEKTYGNGKEAVHALSSVTFRVAKGEFVSIVGPSGCGKSSLLKISLGVVPYSGGSALLSGVPIAGPQVGTGIVFQTASLPPWRNVLNNVLLPIEVLGLPRKEYVTKAQELLKLVGLQEFQHRLPKELSGGMQQRVSICRALIHDPQLLLMDEPFGALDALTRETMQVQLLRIWAETQKTVVLVTHSIDEAILLSDKIIIMSPRPSKVIEELHVDLPRPRGFTSRALPRFQEYAQYLRNILGVGV